MDDDSLVVVTPGTVNGHSPVGSTVIPVEPASSTYYDVVEGNVFARRGLTLTVRGATVIRQDGSVRFSSRDIRVTIGAATDVTSEDGLMGELDTDAIAVGQRIIVFGDACDSEQGVEIDAIEGHVRIGQRSTIDDVVPVANGLHAFDAAPAEFQDLFARGRRRHRPCGGSARSR